MTPFNKFPKPSRATWRSWKKWDIKICPVLESTESRIARGSWRCNVEGYTFILFLPSGKKLRGEAPIFDSYDEALDAAKHLIDSIRTDPRLEDLGEG